MKVMDFRTHEISSFSAENPLKGEKISEMIFADWAQTTDSHLDSNLLMTLKKVQTLNQWNAIINQILFRRSFETKEDLVMSIKSYINSGLFSKAFKK